MAHISNIGAGIFSDITVASAEVTDLSLFNTEAEFVAVFSGIKVLDTDFYIMLLSELNQKISILTSSSSRLLYHFSVENNRSSIKKILSC